MKPRPDSGCRVIPDGLGQAAGAPGDGDRAVAQRDQRSKAARLEVEGARKKSDPAYTCLASASSLVAW